MSTTRAVVAAASPDAAIVSRLFRSINALSLLLLAGAVLKAGRHRNRELVVPVLGQIAHKQVAIVAGIVADWAAADAIQPVGRPAVIDLRMHGDVTEPSGELGGRGEVG